MNTSHISMYNCTISLCDINVIQGDTKWDFGNHSENVLLIGNEVFLNSVSERCWPRGEVTYLLTSAKTPLRQTAHAPVPLSIFRSNSKFDENSKHSSVKYTRPITTIFCTRHDSVTVVTCAKYRCDRSSIFDTRAFWIFIEFRIRSKYA